MKQKNPNETEKSRRSIKVMDLFAQNEKFEVHKSKPSFPERLHRIICHSVL